MKKKTKRFEPIYFIKFQLTKKHAIFVIFVARKMKKKGMEVSIGNNSRSDIFKSANNSCTIKNY